MLQLEFPQSLLVFHGESLFYFPSLPVRLRSDRVGLCRQEREFQFPLVVGGAPDDPRSVLSKSDRDYLISSQFDLTVQSL